MNSETEIRQLRRVGHRTDHEKLARLDNSSRQGVSGSGRPSDCFAWPGHGLSLSDRIKLRAEEIGGMTRSVMSRRCAVCANHLCAPMGAAKGNRQ